MPYGLLVALSSQFCVTMRQLGSRTGTCWCRPQVEEDFVAAIRKQGSIRRTTFEQGVRYMEFTEAVTRSIQSGCTVRLPLV